MNIKELTALARRAVQICQKAGRILIERENNIGAIHSKSHSNDIVTDIDLLVENLMIQELKKLTFNADFIGEESGISKSTSPVKWIIDPIDGTGYYSKGSSLYSTTLALVIDGIPEIGIIHQPKDNKTFYAIHNHGMFYNERPTHIQSQKKNIRESICYIDTDKIDKTSLPEKVWAGQILSSLLSEIYRVRMFGVSSVAYTWLSLGIIDAFIDLTGKNPEWDRIAGDLIVREAGINSDYVKITDGSFRYIATNSGLWDDYIEILRGGEKDVK